MSTSLTLLGWTLVLGLVHVGGAAVAKRLQEPPGWGAGPRDEPLPRYAGVAARLDRAQANFLETMPFFAAAVLIATAAQREGHLLEWGAPLYFWARLVYLPVYAAGLPYVRTLVWIVAMVGLCLVVSADLLPA